jgi:hypothetical protein
VDRDPSASVPIENIEGGIQGSVACFADVTIDNPNVWFELGYAMLFVLRSRYALSADRRGNAFRLTFSIERLSDTTKSLPVISLRFISDLSYRRKRSNDRKNRQRAKRHC